MFNKQPHWHQNRDELAYIPIRTQWNRVKYQKGTTHSPSECVLTRDGYRIELSDWRGSCFLSDWDGLRGILKISVPKHTKQNESITKWIMKLRLNQLGISISHITLLKTEIIQPSFRTKRHIHREHNYDNYSNDGKNGKYVPQIQSTKSYLFQNHC